MSQTHMIITPGEPHGHDPLRSAHVHARDCDHTIDYIHAGFTWAMFGVDTTPRADLANRVADRCEQMHGRRPLEVIVGACIAEAAA